MTSAPLRIGMWSGPRNLSTAMMRSFSSRDDTATADEPFYAHFLKTTNEQHPGRDEVFAEQDSDWKNVVDMLTGPIPGNKPVWYQKVLTHHIVGNMSLDWTEKLTNCFLIRHPKDMILSYQKIYPKVDISLLGWRQQVTIFDLVYQRTGEAPIVVEADDIANNPKAMLSMLCDRLGIPFTDKMLSWQKGPHPSYGSWGKYWYKNVMNTTGFHPFEEKHESIQSQHMAVYEECLDCYLKLQQYTL